MSNAPITTEHTNLSPDTLASMSDEEWFNMNLQSVHTRVVHGLQMPGFPDESWQRQFVGSSGCHALREVLPFYRFIKQRAAQLSRPLKPVSRVLDFGVGW